MGVAAGFLFLLALLFSPSRGVLVRRVGKLKEAEFETAGISPPSARIPAAAITLSGGPNES
jgi:hypothetical protein